MNAIAASPITMLFARDAQCMGVRLDREPGLSRVRRGVYVSESHWRALDPWDRYLVRVHAVAATWRQPVFSHESAAVLLGLPLFGEPRGIHILSQDDISRRKGDVSLHSVSDSRDIITVDRVNMTSLVETTVDLCRVLPPAFGLATADAAMRALGPTGQPFIAERGRRQSNTRGLRRLDWVGERADGRSESPGESCSRAVIEWLGYPAPEIQTTFHHEGHEDRVDFFWRRRRVIGESDGFGKYIGPHPDDTRTRLVAEKQREDRLRRNVGVVARWDFADVMHPARLDAKLRAAGLEPVRPPQRALLRTLERNPR